MTATGPAAPPPGALLGIVVVNFASHALLEDLVPLDLAAIPARVVLVDSFSSSAERSAADALARRAGWEFVALDTNAGFGAGCNAGAAAAKASGCTSYLLLNPDARIDAAAARALLAHSATEPMTLLSPVILRPDGSTWFRGGRICARTGDLAAGDIPARGQQTSYLTGACLVAHGDLWSRLRGFDDDYFLYWEDVDLSYRCVRDGGRLAVRSDLTAVHAVGGTQAGDGKSVLYYYSNCRGRLLFASKHLPRRALLRWLVHTPRSSWAILLRGGRRQLVHSPAPLWATLRGSLAGAGRAVRALARPAAGAHGGSSWPS